MCPQDPPWLAINLIDRSRDHEGSAKVELLLEWLEAVREEGHQALVFSQFTSLRAIVSGASTNGRFPYEYLEAAKLTREDLEALLDLADRAQMPVRSSS